MAETTYYKDKLYLPREIQEKLRLSEGDRLRIEVVGRGEIHLRVIRRAGAGRRILVRLENPPDLGQLTGQLTRSEIYKSIA